MTIILRAGMFLLAAMLGMPGAALAQDGPLPKIDMTGIPSDMPVSDHLPKMIKVILVGDSTTQVASGWGGAFCAFHVTSVIACIDLAKGGRSSGSYRAERWWDIALDEMKSGGFAQTYVLIQFGHNDKPGRPGRSVNLATDFPNNFRKYVADARAAGAIPILVTPITQRRFVNGQLEHDLEPYAEAIRKVAAQTGATVIDLNADSGAAVQAMGPVAATRLAVIPPPPDLLAAAQTGTTFQPLTGMRAPHWVAGDLTDEQVARIAEPLGDPQLVFDYTHLGPEGADYFARIVTRELAQKVPALRRGLLP